MYNEESYGRLYGYLEAAFVSAMSPTSLWYDAESSLNSMSKMNDLQMVGTNCCSHNRRVSSCKWKRGSQIEVNHSSSTKQRNDW
jgi:hypothetical protein